MSQVFRGVGQEEEEEEGDQEAARERALAEARLLLRDRPARRRTHGHRVAEEVRGALLSCLVLSYQGCRTGSGVACTSM